MFDIGDDDSTMSTDKRGESQGISNKRLNFGEMALQNLQRGRRQPRTTTVVLTGDQKLKISTHYY